MWIRLFMIILVITLLGAGCSAPVEQGTITATDQNGRAERPESVQEANRVDFSEYNPVFKFSADIPANFLVEYVPQIESINIYNPEAAGDSAREQSQIFIRYFEANTFLTLSTVDILAREETEINGHTAVRYEIQKKPGVPDFPHQPSWRNGRHKLTDIRYQKASPSYFYVFSYNPDYPEQEFEAFLRSITFQTE